LDPDRTYRHFCMTARALEVIGDRWTLLIVRDLLLGPRRFTDLEGGLREITPTRLTGRLRQLESGGIVARDSSQKGREVWYHLTDAGLALAPVVDALTLWGIEHRLERPVDGEPVHPVPTMLGTKVWLNNYGPDVPDDLSWVWRFPDQGAYTLRRSGGVWELSRGAEISAAVTVLTTPHAWASFLTSPPPRRRLPSKDIALEGSGAQLKRFAKAFSAQLAPARRP
jgi:DNA-binding HxlR family transcriptional regulator